MPLSGNIFDYVIVFASGVAISFTPCVYPLMPITASVIGGLNVHGSKLKGFVISLLYVLGVAITYSALGVFAALTGKVFGQILNHPGVYIAAANVIILFALAMLDVIPLPLLGLASISGKIKPTNIFSIVLLGMVSGLVIGPCTAPVLGTILLYIASKQNVFHGASLLFVFAYGAGVSLILVGTFSGILANLPKSGVWLNRVKHAFGLFLLIIAEFLLIKAGGLF